MMDYAAAYTKMHRSPKVFRGFSIKDSIDEITALVNETGARTLLDYGCGKGEQYFTGGVHHQWGIMPTLYDIGVPQFSRKPEGIFDGVICTDVMEHIEEKDIDRVLDDIIGYADLFAYFYIACRPAKRKKLPDGRNVHLTVKPPHWWDRRLARAAKRALRGVQIEAKYDDIA